MNVFIEAICVGILVVIIGFIVSYIISSLSGKTNSVNKDWNKYHIMEISLFLTGMLTHLICEFTGINKYYCKYGTACKK